MKVYANTNLKKNWVVILSLDKVDCRAKIISREKKVSHNDKRANLRGQKSPKYIHTSKFQRKNTW